MTRLRRRLRPLALLALCALAGTGGGELAAQAPRLQKAAIELRADRTAYEAGEAVRLAAVMSIDDGWHSNSHVPTYDWLIPTELSLTLPAGWPQPAVSYPPGVMKSFRFAEEPISVYEGRVRFLATFEVPRDSSLAAPVVRASLRYQACDDNSCLPPVSTETQVILTLGSGGDPVNRELFAAVAPQGAQEGTAQTAPARRLGLVWILLLGVAGGLILNAMPCVLPVLSLKVFGMIRSANEGRSRVVEAGLATSLGILISFWALAGAAVLAKQAGAAVGWGTQFQHPGFVTFLAVVVVLFCLNLWGLFEISLPGRLAEAASSGAREGIAGHLVSGLFATLMATPCSAPFLGTAVGFALTQPAATIFATFTAIGFGMAIPYLLLAAVPGAARIFPRPGAWMDHVRKAMGFLLAAAVVWLLYVLSNQVSPERLAFIEAGLLVLALFVWMGGAASREGIARRIAAAGVLAAVAGTLWLAVGAAGGSAAADPAGMQGGLIEWIAFDRAEAEALAAEGRLVFVDVTADWCLTCKVNERVVLESEEVAAAFTAHGVVPMRADWTNQDEEIGAYLAAFGKAGIPFYVLYRPGAEPHVFSELLTRNSVISALRQADGSAATRVGG